MGKLLKIIIVVIFLLILGAKNSIYSQNNNDEATEQRAIQYYQQKNYSEALPLFSQLLSLYPKDERYNLYYAACLIETNQLIEKAIKYLQFSDSKSSNPIIKYYLGRAHHLMYQFQEAIDNYKLFKQKASAKQIKDLNIDKLIDMCNNGLDLIKYISDLTVVDNRRIKSENYFYSYDLKEFNGKLVIKPKELKSSIDKKKEPANMVIFLPNNSNIIYYGSYGKNKNNGRDIYRIERLADGKWGKPENLGPIINTKFDEDYPFLHADGKTLYFSSKGHNSMGGYDIFKSEFDSMSMKWSTPVNMDFPINTPYDDYLYITDKDNFYAFFTSNRETRDNNITVYKIIVDKNPVKREFKDLEEVKNISRLNVSSIAEIKKAEEAKRTENTNEQDIILATNEYNNSFINITPYTFKPITYKANLTSQEVSNDLKADKEKIQKNAGEIKRQSHLAYIIAKDKNEIANQKRKEAYEKNVEIKSLTDPIEIEQEKQNIYQLIKEAEELELQAITAYNLAQNFEQIANEMEKDISKMNNFITAIENQSTVDEAIVDAANKNKERLELSQNKYSSLQKKFENRKNIQINKENDLIIYEQMFISTSDSINQLNNKIKDLENKRNNSNSETEKNFISIQLDELNKQLEVLEAKQVEIAELIEKSKIDIENLNNENLFIKQFAEIVSNDKRTLDELNKLPIEKKQLKKDIFEKELSADIVVAQAVKEKVEQRNIYKTYEKESNTFENNTLTQDTNKTTILKHENTNFQSKESLKLKQDNNDKLQKNTISKINPLLPISTQTNTPTVENLEKELLNHQYYSSIVREQKQKLDIINNAINKSKNKKENEFLEQQKTLVLEEIQNNQKELEQSQQKINEYKKILANQIDTTISRTDEELVLKASKYDNKYEINFSLSQKRLLADAEQNRQDIPTLQEQIQKTMDKVNQLEMLKNSSINTAEQKKLQNDIDNQVIHLNQLFRDYSSKIDNSNQNQLNVYNQILSTVRNYDAENPNVKTAQLLEKEIEALQNKSEQLKKQAIVVNDNKQKLNLYKKADIIEQIAIQKQKYAIDLYVSSHKELTQFETAKSNETALVSNNDTNQTKNVPIEITPEESKIIYQYQNYKNKADLKLFEGNSIFKEAEEKRQLAEKAYSKSKKKEILKDVDKKEKQAMKLINNAHNFYAEANSMKYYLYKNKLHELIQNDITILNENKPIALQFAKEAEFYYDEAQQIRATSQAAATNSDKVKLLEKALIIEQKALKNQEYALDVLTNNEPVDFVVINNLTKIDRLQALDKPVDVKDVVPIKSERILSNLILTEQEKITLDKLQEILTEINQLMDEAKKYEAKLNKAKEVAQNSLNKSKKKKAEKSIPKLEKEYFARKFKAIELSKNVNDEYYDLYQSKLSNIRPKNNTIEAKQGKQLEKEANKLYIQAKQLRDKSFITENPYLAYNYLLQADSIEKLAIEQQEKAFGLYLKLKPLDEEIKEYAEKHPKTPTIDDIIIIKTPASVTPITNEELAQLEQDDLNKVENIPLEKNSHIENEIKTKQITDKNNETEQLKNKAEYQDNKTQNETEQPTNQNLVTELTDNERVNQPNVTEQLKNKAEYQDNKTQNETEQPTNQNLVTELTDNESVNQPNVTEQLKNKAEYQDNITQNETEQPINQNLVTELTDIESVNQPNVTEQLKNKAEYQDNITQNETEQPTNQNLVTELTDIESVNQPNVTEQLKNKAEYQDNITQNVTEQPTNQNLVTELTDIESVNQNNETELANNEDVSQNILNKNKILPTNQQKHEEDYKENLTTNENNNSKEVISIAENLNKNINKNVLNNQAKTIVPSNVQVPMGFSFMSASYYSESNPIPINQSLSEGLVFKVQIGAFYKPVKPEKFARLSPLSAEKLPGSKYYRYFVGMFYSEAAAVMVRDYIKPMGYSDAFVVAFYNGKRITLYEARKLIKQFSTPEYNKLIVDESEKIKNVTSVSPLLVQKNNIVNNQTIKNTISKPTLGTLVNNTKELFYTVQIGVYKNPVSHAALKNLMPLYEDHSYGFIRYLVGKFSSRKQADIEKNKIVALGIEDAFVSAYYNGQKITLTEAANIEAMKPNVVIKSSDKISSNYFSTEDKNNNKQVTEVDVQNLYFSVQISSFKEKVPVDISSKFIQISCQYPIEQLSEGEWTIYYTGKFKSYDEAVKCKTMLSEQGFPDAFIIATDGKKKVPINQAKVLLNK